MNIETWPIERPVPYAKNARKWSERAIATLASSVKEYGFRQPIVVDAQDVIVIGHLRLAAAKSLGLAEVPVHVALDLTAAQIKGLRIADNNRTSQEASWDFGLLAPELLDLKALDFDLGLTGFDTDELDGLLIQAGITDGLTDEDATPEAPAEPVSVLGDLWLLGGHRVLTGRLGRLMELDPKYVDVIVNRWQSFAGKAATLDGDGRTFDEVKLKRAA